MADYEALCVGVLAAVIAVITVHRNTNLRKLELLQKMSFVSLEQFYKIQTSEGKAKKQEQQCLRNSLEYLAINYNRNLLHREVCREFFKKNEPKKMLEQSDSHEIELMRRSLASKKLWFVPIEFVAENVMSVPFINEFRRVYNWLLMFDPISEWTL
ncbi:MAG: hypothetical protein PHV13_00675 [Candidatus ainarchaeum sp.]|nr:hypothetical protein [Candidatus ainarchaeum sp.]